MTLNPDVLLPDWERCGCICQCRWRGQDEFGMCGNCVRWWIAQSDRQLADPSVKIKHSAEYEA